MHEEQPIWNPITCDVCERIYETVITLADGTHICENCFDEAHYHICGDCGCIIDPGDEYHDPNGDPLCDDCYHDHYGECASCGRIRHQDNLIYYEQTGEFYCTNCTTICDSCGEYIPDEHIERDDNNIYLCRSCLNDEYYICENCRNFVHSDNTHERNGCIYCGDCYDDISTIYSGIHNYGYMPTLHFYGNPAYRKYGVELEIDDPDGNDGNGEVCESVMRFADGEKLYYLKSDGSLSDNGFELVTHPCSLFYHLTEFPWKSITDNAKAHGFMSHSALTCGLHIHTNRDQSLKSSEDDFIRNLVFLSEKYRRELIILSRRKSSQLRWCESYDNDNLDPKNDEYKSDLKMKNGHYRTINITRDTIEFRLPRGSLNLNTIFATLELYDSMLRIADDMSIDDLIGSTWEQIKPLLIENTKYLSDYMTKRGL